MWSRIHLVPLLMAEGDRDAYRRQQAALAREREIMKDVPGWEVRSGLNMTDILGKMIDVRLVRASITARNTVCRR